MKALQINAYGTNDVLEVNPNAPKPILKLSQLLIENFAASINAIDWKIRAGYLAKMIKTPFPITLGGDFAGKVTQVSEGVTEFTVGDDVYGSAIFLNGGSGAIAEFVAANTKNLAIKPTSINFEKACALPLVGTSAIQVLEEHMKLQDGQKILIHGGAGGIGHVAIQLAKALGAYVATTVKSDDVEFVKGLGADEVIDYKTQKFEEILKDFDAVFDIVGGEVVEKSFKVLKKGGILVSMVGQPNPELAIQFSVTAIGQQTKTTTEHLNQIATYVDSGKIKVYVDKIFTLEESREAFEYQEKIHPKSKVVIKIKE